jgi:DNA replication protein DnaC
VRGIGNLLTSQNSTLTKDGISLSDKRCSTCKRYMQIKEGHEYCFHCDFIQAEDKKLAKEIKQKHDQQKVLSVFKEESLINPRLKECTFTNYVPTSPELSEAKEKCIKFAEDFDKSKPDNLILMGNYGTGKSHMAVSILKRVIARGLKEQGENLWNGIFISTPKLMTKLKATYNKGSNHSEDELLSSLEKVDLLVLDDVGAELKQVEGDPGKEQEANSWAIRKLLEIVDGRIGRSTIYTTNFGVKELMKLYGERNFSRMMEGTKVLRMQGKNYRLRQFE